MKIFEEYRQDWTFLPPPSLDEFVVLRLPNGSGIGRLP